MGRSRVDCRCQNHTHKRKKIREVDHAAFMAFLRAVLDQSVNGNDKKSTRKTERPQEQAHLKKTQPVNRDGERKYRHGNGAKGDKAILDLPPSKYPSTLAPTTY